MDIGTIIGIVLAMGLIIGAIMLGGSIGAFIDIPSILIVVGGVFACAFIMFPTKAVLGSIKVLMKTIFASSPDPMEQIRKVVQLADIARRQGLVELEKAPVEDPFLKKGVMLVSGGTEERLVHSILDNEINYMRQRHLKNQGVFKKMGEMAPAFGMIGTLIGLVQMLQNLNDPSAIGPAMAVALLTTFYGSVLANVIFLPLAKKLEERSEEEILYLEVLMEGILSILNGDHPTIIKEKLEAFLAPMMRETQE